jgi:hypothetical protein
MYAPEIPPPKIHDGIKADIVRRIIVKSVDIQVHFQNSSMYFTLMAI